MPPKRPGADDVDELRIRSRQQYLQKREAERLALLRKQVAEEAEEERSNPNLSRRELDEFKRNRETLRLAESRLAIDDHLDGYILPDADYSNKSDVLYSKTKDKEKYVSEVDQWENEVSSRAKAAQVQRPARERQEDYEFVFDTSQELKWDSDIKIVDPEKARLQSQLDAAETRIKTIEETRKSLPMFPYREQILAAIEEHQILVLIGETGSGKSTQIPQYLYETGYGKAESGSAKSGLIGITQPRRVAAMSVAQRVSEEVGCKLGHEVGYSIRFENKTTEKTKIKYMTDGMLLRELLSDPMLSQYSCIMLDEAHERSTNTDILMGLLKDLARLRRDDFKLLISSATLDAQKFSRYFDDAPIFSIPGRTFSVDIYHSQQPESSVLSAAITTIFQIHLSQPPGDILVFLTGQDEIEAAQQNIEETARKLGSRAPELIVRPLYSALPTDEQNRVFEPTPSGARKCVLATNIAETSLTVDGVKYVIDSGLTKEHQFQAQTGLEALVITPCSRASANQRAGRAGRTGPGLCFRLYTKWSALNEMDESTTPEILRIDLCTVLLMLKSLGINDLINFDFMDPPPPATMAAALEHLYALSAINDQGVLTRVGRKMAEIPLSPMFSRAILAADQHGCVEEVVTIVAMLSESATLFLRPKDKKLHADAARNRFVSREGGDFLTLLNVYTAWAEAEYDVLWAKENYLQQRTLNRARDVRDQLVHLCDRVEIALSSAPSDIVAIKKAITAGFFPHVSRLQNDGFTYRTAKKGMTVYIHPSSSCSQLPIKPKWVCYSELVLTSKEYMRMVMPIEPEHLVEVAPHFHTRSDLDKLGVDKKMPKEKAKTGNGPAPRVGNNPY